MRLIHLLLFATPVFFVLVNAVSAQDASTGAHERVAFKEFRIGDSVAAIRIDQRFICRKIDSLIADELCHNSDQSKGGAITIAGVKAVSVGIYATDSKISATTVGLSPADFQHVTASLTEKYGPAVIKESALTTRAGVKYKNVQMNWDLWDDTIEAHKYDGRIDRSTIVYRAKSAMEDFERREKEQIKAGASDL